MNVEAHTCMQVGIPLELLLHLLKVLLCHDTPALKLRLGLSLASEVVVKLAKHRYVRKCKYFVFLLYVCQHSFSHTFSLFSLSRTE